MALIKIDRHTPRPARRWTPQTLALLQERYATTDTRELAFVIGKPYEVVRSMATRRGLHKAKQRRRWSEQDMEILRERYANTSARDIATELNASISYVHQRAAKLGLRKSIEFVRASGRMSSNHPNVVAARFQKGQVPPNKGQKMPADLYAKCAPTMFKTGAKPQTWVPVGTEVVDPDGYRKRKVSDDRSRPSRFNWKFVHVLLWEEKNGPVPSKHMVSFRVGNRHHLVYENLQLLSMAENARRNKKKGLKKKLLHNTYQF